MIYIGAFLSTLFASFLNIFRGFPSKKTYFFLCLLITVIVAFRYASVDYFSYLRIYDGVSDLSKIGFFIYELNLSTPVESGFAVFILIEKLLFGHYFFFVVLFSFFSLFIKFSAFKKLSPYLLLSLLLYLSDEYFWKDLGQIRNSMASGIILWAFYHAYSSRFWHFFALVIVAMLFHSAAIIALPFYFIRWFKSPFFLFLALIFSILIVALFGGVGKFIPEIAMFLGFDENARVVKYAQTQYVTGISPFGGTFFLQLLVCLLLIFFYGRLSKKWVYNEFLIPVYVYSSCLFFLLLDYGIIGGRIREMLAIPVTCVVIPSFILLFRGYSRIVPYAAIASYCIIWFYLMMRDRAPYQSIFQFLF